MDKTQLKIGDKVIMNGKYFVKQENRGKVWTCTSEPWMCCGSEIILLEGYKGGCVTDGLSKIKE